MPFTEKGGPERRKPKEDLPVEFVDFIKPDQSIATGVIHAYDPDRGMVVLTEFGSGISEDTGEFGMLEVPIDRIQFEPGEKELLDSYVARKKAGNK